MSRNSIISTTVMSNNNFWDIMKLLVERDWNKNMQEDVQIWINQLFPERRWEHFLHENSYRKGSLLCEDKSANKKAMLSEYTNQDIHIIEDIENFLRKLKLPKIDCRFSHPQIRSRLEKLMGSNIVRLTDRDYMQKLQERILEDYAESMDKRIRVREEEELERVKNLVLIGKIPLDQAPPEMAQHPVMLIENYCKKLIAERRAKIKIYKVMIPTYLYWDDTPDPESGLSIEKGHVFRAQGDRLCSPYERFLEFTEDEDIEKGYMLSPEEYEKIKYEDPLVQQLRSCETVEEMYILADQIIGALKTIDETTRIVPDTISENLERNTE